MDKKLPDMMNEKQQAYIQKLITLTKEICEEIEWTHTDYDDNLHEQEQKQQLMDDLVKVEKHLRKTAKLFTHLQGHSFPHWGTIVVSEEFSSEMIKQMKRDGWKPKKK